MRALLLFFVALVAAPSGGLAQRCSRPPAAAGEPWPDRVEVPSQAGASTEAQFLTRAEGESIRCALEARLRRPIDRMPSDLEPLVRDRRVGAPWLDEGRPRIGAFWLQGTPDGQLEVSYTLAVGTGARIALVARFARQGASWRLGMAHVRISHAVARP